jgi:6-phospho-beta-glucosidase
MLGADHRNVSLDHVGLNHFTWELGVNLTTQGSTRNVLPELLSIKADEIAAEVRLPASLLALQSAVPSYYLRYYYRHDQILAHQREEPSRAQEVMEVERSLLVKYADLGLDEKPAELSERGGAFYSEAAVDLMSSLTRDGGDVQVVNLLNNGTLPFLPDDHVIEVPAVVEAKKLTAQPVAPLPEDMTAMISHVAGYERLALEAALHGGRHRVVRALLAHPFVGQYDKAEKLADLLIASNREHLAWAK